MRTTSRFADTFLAGAFTACCLLLPHRAQAQVTVSTTPFTGTFTENFESFPNYLNYPGAFLPETSIMGGAATVGGPLIFILEPSAGARFFYSFGDGQPADGTKFLGSNGAGFTTTLRFNSGFTQFGGSFMGDHGSIYSDTFTFTFRDAGNGIVGTQTFDVNPTNSNTGVPIFYAFTSASAFTSVSITGDFLAMDNLRVGQAQAGTGSGGAAPEPGALALLLPAVGLAAIARRRTARRN